MKNFTKENIEEIINYQMELNSYNERYEELKKIDNWYNKFTTTKEKEEKFIKYLKKYLSKFYSKRIIERIVPRFILNYGLTIIETDNVINVD